MRIKSRKLLASLVVLAVVPLATAGTPLICFPYEIGNAKSLPWIDDGGIGKPIGDYDIKQLGTDTVALLAESTPVIVRMETIRRAVLYTSKDDAAATRLIARMKTRAMEGTGNVHALALFDYGYLLETVKQAGMGKTKTGSAAPTSDGYGFVLQALKARGNDPEMEFAAARIAMWPKQADYEEHLRRAAAGAGSDPLLATNLRSHFPTLHAILDGVAKNSK